MDERVRDRYAEAALAVIGGAAGDGCCGAEALRDNGEVFGAALYESVDRAGIPDDAVLASLGCGNPVAVADLRPGERVLDLGSGGGLDVLLSARRVGPTGWAYGVDATPEMIALAGANARAAGATNVSFLLGTIESVPLSDGAVDAVISNCVVNLSADKPAVLREMARVLRPGGRIGLSDVVAEDRLSPADRMERARASGCIAGALSRSEYVSGLTSAGFVDVEVRFTHEVADGLHGAIVRAVRRAG